MCFMLSVMQDGLQIQAVAPVLVKVAVQHQLCTQRRASDAEPSGFLIAPRDWERVGNVSNVPAHHRQ